MKFGDERELGVEGGLELGEDLSILCTQPLHHRRRDYDFRHERTLLLVGLLEQRSEVTLKFD